MDLVLLQIPGPEPNTVRAMFSPTAMALLSPAPPGRTTKPGLRCSGNRLSSKKSRSCVHSIRLCRHAYANISSSLRPDKPTSFAMIALHPLDLRYVATSPPRLSSISKGVLFLKRSLMSVALGIGRQTILGKGSHVSKVIILSNVGRLYHPENKTASYFVDARAPTSRSSAMAAWGWGQRLCLHPAQDRGNMSVALATPS